MTLEKKDILYLVFISFLLILIVKIYNLPIPPTEINNSEINKLNKILLENKLVQDSLEQNIKKDQDKIILLEHKLYTNNIKITQINQQYAKKIDSINNFQSSNIKEYFTKRYSK